MLIILIISLNIYYDQNLNYSKSQIGIRTIIINNTQFFLKQKNLNYVGFNIDYFKEKNKFSVFYFEEKGLNIYEFILNEKFEIVNFYHKKEIHKDLSFRDKLFFITKMKLEKLGYHTNDFKFEYSKNDDLIIVKYMKEDELYSVEFLLDYNFKIIYFKINDVLQKEF
ncbi:MAG: hypothetical protein WC337_10075 [Candidatus Muiribacteriota bacterium]